MVLLILVAFNGITRRIVTRGVVGCMRPHAPFRLPWAVDVTRPGNSVGVFALPPVGVWLNGIAGDVTVNRQSVDRAWR